MLGEVLQWIKRRKVVVLVLVFSFIVSGLIINLLELATLPLYVISKKWFRIVNAKIVYLHWCVVPWALESWANYKIEAYTDDTIPDVNAQIANREHAIVTMNHPGDLDWMVGWVLINRVGMLGGTKAIMKDIARFLPGIGWTFIFMEYPLLKRDWSQDQSSLVKACRNLRDYPVHMLLCLFAEGTRFTKEKHRMSMDFARSRGYPQFKHHLFPRTKGFCLLMRELRESVPAVYDITIVCHGDDPSLLDVVNAKPSSADILVRRFPTKDLPHTDPEMADWLINLYKEKDDLVDYHKKHGRFPDSTRKVTFSRSYLPDLIVLVWVCLLGIPAFFTAVYLAWVGAWLTLGVILASIFVADLLFQYIANETDKHKSGSSYGLQPTNTSSSNSSENATPTDNKHREPKKEE